MESESAPMDTGASGSTSGSTAKGGAKKSDSGSMFTLKKWNAVAMWSWDVECDTCAICRVQGNIEVHLFTESLPYIRLFTINNTKSNLASTQHTHSHY